MMTYLNVIKGGLAE